MPDKFKKLLIDANVKCAKDGVATLRGLKLMATIVNKGGMSRCEAVAIAEQIQKTNPHITPKIIETLKESISAVTGENSV